MKGMIKMTISNMNYFFNKSYYDFLKNIAIDNKKEKIIENDTITTIISKNNNDIIYHRYQENTFLQPLQDILSSFEMKVEYPGLLL